MHVALERHGELFILVPAGYAYRGRFYGRARGQQGWVPFTTPLALLPDLPYVQPAPTPVVRGHAAGT